MQTLTQEQKLSVRNANHYVIYNYPKNWQDLPEYQNWGNSQGNLCGFVEIGNYLTTTVF